VFLGKAYRASTFFFSLALSSTFILEMQKERAATTTVRVHSVSGPKVKKIRHSILHRGGHAIPVVIVWIRKRMMKRRRRRSEIILLENDCLRFCHV
jgi:hypothetical protein